jgi:hypothetical protein
MHPTRPKTRLATRLATRFAIACSIAIAAATFAAASPAQAAPAGRIVIGDSVSGMNTGALQARGFRVDYTVSRQFGEILGVMASYGSALPRNVVIALGTNGTVSLSTCKAAVRAAGTTRRVFLVTNRVPRSWESTNNAALRACDRAFTASRVHIIDWWALSDSNPSWFYGDGYHPNEWLGAQKFANLVDRAVDTYGR